MRGEFREASAELRNKAVPMSHLSIEVGHLYLEDLRAGPDRLAQLFAEAAPWVRTAQQLSDVDRPRVSTCFLIDDYFSDLAGPAEVLPGLLNAAARAGVGLDYLARESACAALTGPAGAVSPARMLVAQLVTEPLPHTTGARPPPEESGWLSNGQRSPGPSAQTSAMQVGPWSPPSQTAARGHSVFVDVELWSGQGEDRLWSCALLAAAWQLLRLGLSRHLGQAVVKPEAPPPTWPARWADLPAVVKVNPAARPFAAYRTLSVMSPRFLPVELAVRTILSQVWHDPNLIGILADLAAKEGVSLPLDALDRIGYVLVGSGSGGGVVG